MLDCVDVLKAMEIDGNDENKKLDSE